MLPPGLVPQQPGPPSTSALCGDLMEGPGGSWGAARPPCTHNTSAARARAPQRSERPQGPAGIPVHVSVQRLAPRPHSHPLPAEGPPLALSWLRWVWVSPLFCSFLSFFF